MELQINTEELITYNASDMSERNKNVEVTNQGDICSSISQIPSNELSSAATQVIDKSMTKPNLSMNYKTVITANKIVQTKTSNHKNCEISYVKKKTVKKKTISVRVDNSNDNLMKDMGFNCTKSKTPVKVKQLHNHFNDKRSNHKIKKSCLVKENSYNTTNSIKSRKICIQKFSLQCKFCLVHIAHKYESQSQYDMQRHVVEVHDKIKRYNCEECSYSSYIQANVKTHMNGVHNKTKHYKCHKCKFTTYWKKNLTDHQDSAHL